MGANIDLSIFFVPCNLELGGDKPIFGQLEENKKEAPFSVEAGECFLMEDKTCGKVTLFEEENALHPEYMSNSGIDKNCGKDFTSLLVWIS